MGTTWGPPGSCRPQLGPMLAPWTLLSGNSNLTHWGLAMQLHTRQWAKPCLVQVTACRLFGAKVTQLNSNPLPIHDDVIKWKHFPHYWSFVRRIHRSPIDSLKKSQWHSVLMFPLICTWTNDWANNRDVGDLRRHRVHYDVTVMWTYHLLNGGHFVHVSMYQSGNISPTHSEKECFC